jgi:hypothetical protein
LHRESSVTLKSWENDARRKLRKKFDTVAIKCASVQQKEMEARKRSNVNALKEWAAGDALLMAENVQVLAGVVTEVMQLVEPEGRVSGVLDIFEEWITYTDTVWESRHQHKGQADVEFVESLGGAWKDEVKALMRRLAALNRVLDGLERPRDGSSLGAVWDGVGELVRMVGEELKAVSMLEIEIVETEKRYVDLKVAVLEGGIVQENGVEEDAVD